MPRALLFLLTTVSLFGQFYGLSTNNDGTQLYFSAPLQLSGTTNENPYSKIFRYDSAGLHFVAQMDPITLPNGSYVLTNAYNLVAGYISGNGNVTGYVGNAGCGPYIAPGCSQTTLFYQGLATTLPYSCAVSKSARYAACAIELEALAVSYAVYDIFGSVQTPAYIPLCNPGPGDTSPLGTVSSDGHFLCGATLWSASGATTVNLQGNVNYYDELLSDDGSHIVTFSKTSLFSYNVAAGTTTPIPLPDGIQVGSLGSLSSDGSVILFYGVKNSVSQLDVIHADGSGLLQVTNSPVSVSSVLLSGDGSTAFGVNTNGELVKIDTTSGASTAIANGAQIYNVQGAAVAGAPVLMTGLGFADAVLSASTVPLGTSVGGVQVTVNGTPAPILSVAPSNISFQIPWETPIGNASIAVVRPGSSFQPPITQLQIQTLQPTFAPGASPSTQDFSALIGMGNPAHPGDIVNFYLTGLGPVTAPVADGTPAPSSPLPRVVNPVTVAEAYAPSTPLAVLYAGLAPGLIGIYQLTVQLPPQIPSPTQSPNAFPLYLILNSTLLLNPVWVVPNQ
jgi:uncharacterized protein (TIGR03437 family)